MKLGEIVNMFVLYDDSYFSEGSIQPLELEDCNLPTNNGVSLGEQQPFNDCVSSSVVDANSATNLSVADKTACVSNITSASANSPRGSVGVPANVDIPCDVVNNDIVIDTPLAELSPERPHVTTTRSGRVSKPVQKYDSSRF